MLGGQSLQQTLPPEDLKAEKADELEGLDSLLTTNLADPTAIVTEYRFVILLPTDPDREEGDRGSGEVGGTGGQSDGSLENPLASPYETGLEAAL